MNHIGDPIVPLTTEIIRVPDIFKLIICQDMPSHVSGEINFRRSSSSGAGGGFAGVALRCISSSYRDRGSLKSANLATCSSFMYAQICQGWCTL